MSWEFIPAFYIIDNNMGPKPSISFIVPAYNVAETLENSVRFILDKMEKLHIEDHEILIVIDSKTTDSTARIVQNLVELSPKINVINRAENKSLGLILINSLNLVKKEYYCLYSGKDSLKSGGLDYALQLLGQADIIACYVGNPEIRSWFRRFASRTNVILVNMLFGLKMPYYHFYFCRTFLAKKVSLSSPSYSSMDEILIWLLKSGATFALAPFYLKQQAKQSSAMKLKNISSVLSAYVKLFWKIRILGQRISLKH